MASFTLNWSEVLLSSTYTSMKISMLLLKVLETLERSVTMSPNLIGLGNVTLLTAAVTHTRLQRRWADMAAITSIQCNSLPPIKFPSVLVSLGSTISVLMARVDSGVRVFLVMLQFCAKIKPCRSIEQQGFIQGWRRSYSLVSF